MGTPTLAGASWVTTPQRWQPPSPTRPSFFGVAQQGIAAQALHLLGCSFAYAGEQGPLPAARGLSLAAHLVSRSPETDAQCQRQLSELAARHRLPPLSARQLLFVLHRQVAAICVEALGVAQNAFTVPSVGRAVAAETVSAAAFQSRELHPLAAASVAQLAVLEPDSVQAHHWPAMLAIRNLDVATAAAHFERGLQLARQVGNRFWVATEASHLAHSQTSLQQLMMSSDGGRERVQQVGVALLFCLWALGGAAWARWPLHARCLSLC